MRKVLFIMLACLSCMIAYADTTITDLNKPINVTAKNPVFKIVLNSNPTTGFSWFLVDFDSRFVTPLSETFIPPETATPGRGGVVVWTFKATPLALTLPTFTHVTLSYMRPWIPAEGKTQQFMIVTDR